MKSEIGALGGSDDAAIDEAARLLDEEEKDLWRQLRRKRDFEVRLVEKRSQTEELEKKRMGPRIAQAEVLASLEVLTQEMEFVKSQQRELEHDLAVLKESNRLLQPAFQVAPQVGAQPNQPRTKDALAEERAHMESLQAQQEQIEQLRKHIESLHMEKQSLQQQQEALFQKQRSAEQDQNRLLGSIQDDRNLLNEVRAERIKLLEERASLEKQMAVIVTAHEGAVEDRSRWSPHRRAVPASEKVAQSLYKLPGSSGGVRGHVPQDAPLPQSAWFASVPLQPQDQRSHWTSFEKDAMSSPSFGGQKTLQTT
ncbi:unnamed protein product [Cladocopium goreaui]|uniref:Uncharacterized protein n=1 Tax=Cladocopium goreaui TaxID=2562237 RepID=A0A9P1FLT5_9DINO|nr:unnamed protein product [Cladocopium goreaui]